MTAIPSLGVLISTLWFVAVLLSPSFVIAFNPLPSGRSAYQLFRGTALQSGLLVPQHLDLSQQIFCNVELNGENLEAVGFDMDFTLAQVFIRIHVSFDVYNPFYFLPYFPNNPPYISSHSISEGSSFLYSLS